MPEPPRARLDAHEKLTACARIEWPAVVFWNLFCSRRRACGKCGHRPFDVHTFHRLALRQRIAPRALARLLCQARRVTSDEHTPDVSGERL